jgi:hypothetical protein
VPPYDASNDTWIGHFVNNPAFRITGVMREQDGRPNLLQLTGYR